MKNLIPTAGLGLFVTLSVSPLMAQRPSGVDVSNHQGSINWSQVAGSGIQFAFAKATEGNYFQDAYFSGNVSSGKAAGVVIGAYHYARPDLDSPTVEAGYFWSFAQGSFQHDGLTLMPALDLEVFSGVVGATSYTDWANQWSAAVQSYASGAGLTVHPCIYTSACSACNLNTSISLTPWIADWNGENAQTGTPWSTCANCAEWGAGVWSFWQYSDRGHIRGIKGGVDLDTYDSTYAMLLSSEVVP